MFGSGGKKTTGESSTKGYKLKCVGPEHFLETTDCFMKPIEAADWFRIKKEIRKNVLQIKKKIVLNTHPCRIK